MRCVTQHWWDDVWVWACVFQDIYISIYIYLFYQLPLYQGIKNVCTDRKTLFLCVAACTLNAAVDDTIHVAAAFLQQRQQIKHSLPTVPVTEIPQWRFSATVQERL